MMKLPRTVPQSENRLLARLPPREYRRLLPLFTPVALAIRQVLHPGFQPVQFAYFPTRGMASAVTRMQDRTAIETASIGNEGATGVTGLLGFPPSSSEVFVQVAGQGLRADAAALSREAVRVGPLRRMLVAYQAFHLEELSQLVACNRLHSVGQRCCRRLLMTCDRLGADAMPLTHEFLAIVLGVRRASVTDVLGPLRERCLIRYARGVITVLDRRGLEGAACECYRVVRDSYDRLLG